MLSGSKNTVGWFPGGKAEPGNGPQDQSLARWGGDKQAEVRGKPYPAGPAAEAVCAHCGKEDGEEATSSGRPERGYPGICMYTAGGRSGSEASASKE